jgi:CDP-paratose 2-epimerase
MSILITGGAGFVGASLARRFRQQYPGRRIVAFDNLRRRGSELNLPEYRQLDIEFVHGDIRSPADLESLSGDFEVLVEASAEPSVHAGMDGDPRYLLQTNLQGTLNCLELARQRGSTVVFLSTSRVYSIPALNAVPLAESVTRFGPGIGERPGWGPAGIAESFDTTGFRSLYGATKLASELVIQEYCAFYDLRAVINRCGVIAGRGQWGKVDQGVYTLWVAHHVFDRPLSYMGYGGRGLQVRDLLHPDDLFDLLQRQLERADDLHGEVYNVGGGISGSTSLLEYTRVCQEVSGRSVPMEAVPETNRVDVPYYVTDHAKASAAFSWHPRTGVQAIAADIHEWLLTDKERVAAVFG